MFHASRTLAGRTASTESLRLLEPDIPHVATAKGRLKTLIAIDSGVVRPHTNAEGGERLGM
jgi:hypothetical protein